MWHKVKFTVGVLLILFAIIVTFQNTESVSVKLLFGTISFPMSLLLIATLMIGCALGAIMTGIWIARRKKQKQQ